MAAPSAFQQASVEHIRRLNRLIDRGGVARLRRVYDAAQAQLERRITKELGRGSSPFTVQQYRALLAQVRQGQMRMAREMGDASTQATAETQTEAIRSLIAAVRRVDKTHGSETTIVLPVEEAARFAGVIDQRRSSLLVQNRKSMARYGARLVRSIEGELAHSLASGETTGEAVERVAKRGDLEFWHAERIVRTEQAWAFNATQRDAVHESAKEIPDLFMRWTELVDDLTDKPLDDRVAADSVAMHGQVAHTGELFTMPPWARTIRIVNRYGKSEVSADLIGESWSHPPNRPNDRSALMPWRPGWEVPGWRIEGGRKLEIREHVAR